MVFKKYPPGDFQGGGRCKEGDIYIRPPPIVIFSLKRAVEARTFKTNLFQKFKQKLF